MKKWMLMTAAAITCFSAAAEKPNIVLIMADDLGWADVGYNQTDHDRAVRDDLAKTPNIDRISGEGLRFDRFYVQPICSPTRAALLTGRYAWRSGMASGVVLNHLDYGLPLDETLVSEVLRQAGYATHIVGKWHVGHVSGEYLPTSRGFDTHYGFYTAIDHFTHEWQGALDWHRNGEPVREEGYVTDLLGAECVRIIESHNYKAKPLFLYHPMFAVHAWNQSTEEYMAPYSHVEDGKRRGLLGLCNAMDTQFGAIVDALERIGQLENTLVFFLSDNGGNSTRQAAYNGRLKGSKGTFYEAGIRVPAFAYWPGTIKPGRTTDALAYAADLLPTFASLADAPLPKKPLDGFDLSPILKGKSETTGREEIVFMLEDSERLRRGAIIQWPWKLRRTAKPGGPWVYELYNIAEDPFETANAHQMAKENRETTMRLSDRLDELASDAPDPLWKMGSGDPPAGWKPGAVIGPKE